MAGDATYAEHSSATKEQGTVDTPSGAQPDAGAAGWGLRSFAVVPPYPTDVRRYASGSSDDELGGTEADPGITAALRRRKGVGRPLDRVDADRFGAGFGADLSGVRVHTDREADTMARSVQSVAFTHGSDVYFTRGSFAPGTDSGDHLLAHELAHVVQGSTGRWGSAGGSGVRIGRADDPAEAAADAAADQVMAQLRHGLAPDPAVVGSLPAVQGEPVARTVRRAGLKSLAKKVFKRRKKSSRPGHAKPVGVAPIAQLRAASDAAHAARHQPSSSSSSSGPERKQRSSGRLGGHRVGFSHHDEGSESESEAKDGGYSEDLDLSPFGTAYSLPPGEMDDDLGSESESESESEAKDGGYSDDLDLIPFGTAYSLPPGEMDDDLGSESESESEAKDGGYSEDLDLIPFGTAYSVPPGEMDDDLGSESESESEEDKAYTYSTPVFQPEAEGSESDSEEGKTYTTELPLLPQAPQPVGGVLAPVGPGRARKRGHRAFLTRDVDDDYANERNGLNDDQKGAIEQNAMGRLERAREALKMLEEGEEISDVIDAVRIKSVADQLKTVGDDRDAAQGIVRTYLEDLLEFLRRQEIPLNDDLTLGDISTRRVHYDSEEEQKESLVTVEGGKLVRASGEPVDTSQSSTFFTGNGAEIFVASETGELHMSSHKIGKYHHSSLLAASRVSVGGEMQATGGKINWVSNKSGHYKPTVEHMIQFLHWLGKDGVDLNMITIKPGFNFKGGMTAAELVAGVDKNGMPKAKKGFQATKLKVLLELYEDEYHDEVDDFLQSQGWDNFSGVVEDTDTDEVVDPKEVIAALKARFGAPKGTKEEV